MKQCIERCINNFLSKVAKGGYNFESEADLVLKFVHFLWEKIRDDINHYVLEKPFCDSMCCKRASEYQIFNKKSKRRRSLDLYYENGKKTYVFEFKYHRRSSVSEATDASEILLDLKRLSLLNKKINKYFIYVTDDVMNNYLLKKTRKKYFDFYKNSDEKSVTKIDCFEDKTLKKVFKNNKKKIELKCVKTNFNPNNIGDVYYVRAYEVYSC